MACNLTITVPDGTAVVKDTGGNTLATDTIPSGESKDIIVSPAACDDATAVLKNTDGTTISSTNIASGASQDINAPDATAVLKNTAGTTLQTELIPSNVSEDITAPDATAVVKDTEGNILATENIPSGVSEDIVVASGGVEVLYTYPYEQINTNQDTQYAIGDDKWVRDNVINPEIATWDNSLQWVNPILDRTDKTLLEFGSNPDGSGNNIFGNKQRYTDVNGLQVYGTPYIIDHYLGWAYSVFNPVTSTDWETGIAEIEALTQEGFSDWHLPNLFHIYSLSVWNDTNPISSILQKIESSPPVPQFSSTTRSNSSTQSMAIQSLLRVAFSNKTSVFNKQIICRKAFTYNPTTKEMELI